MRLSAISALLVVSMSTMMPPTAFASLPAGLEFEPSSHFGDAYVARGPRYQVTLDGGAATLTVDGRTALRLAFAGANAHPAAVAEGRLRGVSNYLRGRDPASWRTAVPHYSRVRYRDVYQGIDVVFYGADGNLEYDFELAPGADPRRIRIRFDGAGEKRFTAGGALLLDTVVGEIQQPMPKIYQIEDGAERPVAGGYRLLPDGQVGMALEDYDPRRLLVIDPVLQWATLFTSHQTSNVLNAFAMDSGGNFYVAGSVFSSDYPAQNAPGLQFLHSGDVYVAKLDPTGTAILYTTFLAGTKIDEGLAIAADASGNVYVGGATSSADFPASGSLRGQSDGFLTKLDPSGKVIFSTLIGGDGSDRVTTIRLDSFERIYLAGHTDSAAGFPRTPTTIGPRGLTDAFVARMGSASGAVETFTIIGGGREEQVFALAVDALGRPYVAGTTQSYDFPTRSPLQPALAGTAAYPVTDAFFFRLRESATELDYSTYFGGSNREEPHSLEVDSGFNAYFAGVTSSVDLPTMGAFQPTPTPRNSASGRDGFFGRLDSAGLLTSCSFLGEYILGMGIDPRGNVYLGVDSTAGHLLSASGGRLAASGAIVKFDPLGGFGSPRPLLTVPFNSGVRSIIPDSRGNVFALAGGPNVLPPAERPFNVLGVGTFGQSVVKLAASDLSARVAAPRAARAPVTPGAILTFAASIVNQGPSSADNPTVSGSLPSTVQLVDCKANGVSCVGAAEFAIDGGVRPSLGVGQSLEVSLTVRVKDSVAEGTPVTISLRGRSDLNDPDESNNEIQFSFTTAAFPVSVTPESGGAGARQSFRFQFTHSGGYANIRQARMLLNFAPTESTGCFLVYDRPTNTISMAGAFLGTGSPGSPAILQNDRCIVDASRVAVAGVGVTLTLDLPIAFQTAFSGALNIYASITDVDGAVTAYRQIGAFTAVPVLSPPPTVVSVTPSAGSGGRQTFTFRFSHPDGATAIRRAQVLIGSGVSVAASCLVYFDHGVNSLFLLNDAGATFSPPAPLGSAVSLRNSQCAADPSASFIAESPTGLTLTLTLAFTQAFSGQQPIYAEALDYLGATAGYVRAGAFTVSLANPGPIVQSVTPAYGYGEQQTFTFRFTDQSGYADIVRTQMRILNAGEHISGWCSVYYDRASDAITLISPTGRLESATVRIGSPAVLENQHCVINSGASSSSAFGATLTVALHMRLKQSLNGTLAVSAEALDRANPSSGYMGVGTWARSLETAFVPSLYIGPAVGYGMSQTFTVMVGGYQALGLTTLNRVQVLFQSPTYYPNPVAACMIYFDVSARAFFLMNDGGTTFAGPAVAGTSHTLSNSQCSLDPARAAVDLIAGNITMPVTFSASFAGRKQIYGEAFTARSSNFHSIGSWIVSNSPMADVRIYSDAPPTFFVDANSSSGMAAINRVQLLFTSDGSPSNACLVYYQRTTHMLFLLNNEGSAWLGPMTHASQTPLANSQCAVSSPYLAPYVQDTAGVTFVINFKPAFSGVKRIFAELLDNAGNSAGYQEAGVLTVR